MTWQSEDEREQFCVYSEGTAGTEADLPSCYYISVQLKRRPRYGYAKSEGSDFGSEVALKRS